MANEVIRKLARVKNVPLWKIAHALGISEPTMTRKLRFELTSDETQRMIEIIENLAGEQE